MNASMQAFVEMLTPTSAERCALRMIAEAPEHPKCEHHGAWVGGSRPGCISDGFTACPTGAIEVAAEYAVRVLSLTTPPRDSRRDGSTR